MVRHRFDLRVQHRVIDKARDALRQRRRRDRASVSNLVAAEIRADVIDRPRSGGGLRQRAWIFEAADTDLCRAKRLERSGMFRIAR